MGVVQENRHRVMDLRAATLDGNVSDDPQAQPVQQNDPCTLRLLIGSHIASEARAAIKVNPTILTPHLLSSHSTFVSRIKSVLLLICSSQHEILCRAGNHHIACRDFLS